MVSSILDVLFVIFTHEVGDVLLSDPFVGLSLCRKTRFLKGF